MSLTSTPEPKPTYIRKPDWLKTKLPGGKNFATVSKAIRHSKLFTVCEEARCPNQGECWGAGTATFMILGDTCTRSCGFCAVKTGRPAELDLDEPQRVAVAVKELGLKFVVITSVNRDEWADGGSGIFGEVIRAIHDENPGCMVEVLIPDFKGDPEALYNVLDAEPDVLGHNLETVPRLYQRVRPQARYQQSLDVLKNSKKFGSITKSGIMVGIGERPEEVLQLMKDLRDIDCDIMTLGQYLQPSRKHLPVERYVDMDEFAHYKKVGLEMGFKLIESGPLVRSSYHAHLAVPFINEVRQQRRTTSNLE